MPLTCLNIENGIFDCKREKSMTLEFDIGVSENSQSKRRDAEKSFFFQCLQTV